MAIRFLMLISFFSVGMACHQHPNIKLEPLDLIPYGIPWKIMAPDSAEIRMKEYSIMRDITIRKGNWYFVQIFESEVTTTDPGEVKKNQLESIQQDKYFKELILEDDDGFIYQKKLDNDLIDYDFRFIKILGDKEVIFQTALIGTFTLEQVQLMYASVHGKK